MSRSSALLFINRICRKILSQPGTIDLLEEQSHVAFRVHRGTVDSYPIDMLIYPQSGDDLSMPSLSGRDVMDYWQDIYERTNTVMSYERANYENPLPRFNSLRLLESRLIEVATKTYLTHLIGVIHRSRSKNIRCDIHDT